MPHLSAKTATLWAEYLQAERDRLRGLSLECLERFVDELLAENCAVRREWALDVAASVSDHSADIPVRFPLFRQVLLPVLVDGVLQNQPGCARWLAHFESMLFHSKEDSLPRNLRTAAGLLRAAVELDPNDTLARHRLVEENARYMEYTLHEIPAGVIYGADGATLSQCQDLLKLLSEFKEDVALLGESEKYADLIADCNFHYRTYQKYLKAGQTEGAYEGFVQRQVRSQRHS